MYAVQGGTVILFQKPLKNRQLPLIQRIFYLSECVFLYASLLFIFGNADFGWPQ